MEMIDTGNIPVTMRSHFDLVISWGKYDTDFYDFLIFSYVLIVVIIISELEIFINLDRLKGIPTHDTSGKSLESWIISTSGWLDSFWRS